MGGIVMDQLVTTVRNQQWLAMVSEQKKSGLTIKAWCSENGISENCFYYRQQKLRKRIGSALPTFVEIKPPAEKTETQHLENMNSVATIQIGSVMVRLSNQASGELIRNIMEALYAE